MTQLQMNRLSGKLVLFLSFIALFAVLSGYTHPLQTDEGTAAHIFQISMVLLLLTGLLYFATADWDLPFESLRPLALPAVVVALAFASLYYLEHYRS